MDIAIIGGGHGAHAAAADLAERGHGVRWWRRDAEAFRPLVETRAIALRDHSGERMVTIELASTDPAAVLDGAALVLVPLPASAQESVARLLAPHLRAGQVVFMPPGSFGSYVMAKTVRAAGNRAELSFAEAGTLPWLTRKAGAAQVAITARATRLPAGVFPSDLGEYAFALIERAFPALERRQDALDAALLNAGPVIHPPLILMNAGAIEHFPHWDIHNEGTQPAVRRVTDALDAERIAVRVALGYRAPHFPLADHYRAGGEEWMYGNLAHERLVDSGDWRETIDLCRHRYMREDCACGLALLVSIADWAAVPCPVARGLLALASAVVGEDLRVRGRTLESMDLAGLNRAEFAALLAHGLP